MARQSGPRYDGAVKALCSLRPDVVCEWLRLPIGAAPRIVRLSEVVPPATRQVDALVAVGDDLVVHIEFQTAGEARFARRMLDYRLRLAELPEVAGRRLLQHAIVLGPGRVSGRLVEDGLTYEFSVHYLREQPVEPLLADPHLSPFAVLAAVPDHRRPRVFLHALDLIATVADPEIQATLAHAAVDLAALYLDPATIDRTWEVSVMPIPSLLQRRYDEGHDRGLEQGRELGLEQGRELGLEAAAASMLRHRFGEDERIDAIARRLAPLGPDEYLRRIEEAGSLGELAGA